MGTISIILNIALSYPTASLILCMGLKKFKKIIVNLLVKILAKFISVCSTTLSFVLSVLAMLIGLEIVANFASAVYECLMEGKNGIEIYLKKSKWRFPYKITKEAK